MVAPSSGRGWSGGHSTANMAALGCAALFALVLSAFGLQADRTDAHALLERSAPAAGTVIPTDQAPGNVSLWFSEPVEVAFNALAVSSNSGRVDRLDARIEADDPKHVEVDLSDLAEGTYLVRWQVISIDNHVVRGSYWFSLGYAAAPPASAALLGAGAPVAPPMEVAGRWLTMIAVLTVAGAPFFHLLVLRHLDARVPGSIRALHTAASGRMQRAWLAVACVLVVAELLWAGAQAEAVAAVPLPQALDSTVLGVVLLGSRFAVLWWARLALGLAATALLFHVANRQSSGSREYQAMWVAALLGLLLILSTSLGSHASGARVLTLLAAGMDVVHLAAAAVWLGGLLQLSLLLPSVIRTPPEQRPALMRVLVPRVSTVALASVLVLTLSGIFNAWEQVGTFEALGSTAYGQSLVLKLALLVPLLGIAAINLLIVRPRIAAGRQTISERLTRWFRNLVLAEIAGGAAVVLVVAILVSLPPPGSQNLPTPLEVSRQAGDLRVDLQVDPDWVGISRYRVTLTNADGLPPSRVRDVILTFTMEGMNMGLTTVRAVPRGEGVYETDGFYAGMPGIARVGVAVSQTDAGDQNAIFRIEVPDLNQKQFIGLRPTLGAGPLGLFGLTVGVLGAVAAAGVRREVPRRLTPLAPTSAVLALLLGGGVFVADQTWASGSVPELAGNPTPADPTSLARGQAMYAQSCVVCHGDTGIGNGLAAASLLPPPADLTLHARWHADEQLFWFVTHGVTGTAMPAFGESLNPAERWDVINYLHDLASAPTATPLSALPAPPAPPPPPTALPAPAAQLQSATQPLGRIVFGPDGDKNFWVLTLPDGKPTQLTNFGPLEFTSSPVWSPDGRQIAFSHYQLESARTAVPPGTDLYLMNADGSGVHMLAAHDVPGAALQTPAWAPDSSALYVSYRLQGASLMAAVDRIDVTTGARTRVVANAGYPSLSRDGQRLAYVRFASPDARGETLWSSKPDDSEPQQLLGLNVFNRYTGVRVAPDGQRILFAAVGDGKTYQPPSVGGVDVFGLLGDLLGTAVVHADGSVPWDVWSIDLDGRNLRRVTTLAEDLPVAAWSPDGSYVAFLGGGSFTTSQTGMAVIGADGSGLRRLTTQAGHRGVDWAAPPPSR
jgi:copper transport protein